MSTPGSGPAPLAPGDDELQRLVASLPELYQPIFGHPRLSSGSSRDCDDRWLTIGEVYDRLAADYGRPLRVLDLGCAQGWFSLQCAARGARVQGYDRAPANVAVAEALAERNPGFDAHFAAGSIEEIVPRLSPGQFDLVLGLSVFHHLCAERGQDYVRDLLAQLLERVPNALLELALAGEPPEWARALPADPAELLVRIPFFRVLSRHQTHLSQLKRPLYFCSRTHWLLQGMGRFEGWSQGPGRRIFGGGRHLAKLYHEAPAEVAAIERELDYLGTNPQGLPPRASVIESGRGDGVCWLALEYPPGECVAEWIQQRRAYEPGALLRQLLRQLVAWEHFDLFDVGLRAASLWASPDGLLVADGGTLMAGRNRLPAPAAPFLNFWICVHELLNRVEVPAGVIDPRFYLHAGLPQPWSGWAMQFWSLPMSEWSFARLLESLPQAETTPESASKPDHDAATPARRRDQLLVPLGYSVHYRMQPKYRGAPQAEVCVATQNGVEYFAVMDAGHFTRLHAMQHAIPHMVPIARQVEDCFLFPAASGRLLWDCDPAPDPARLKPQLLAFAAATRRLGLIHGDLRPWNIFFDPEHGVQVIDWGHGGFVDELRLGSFALGHIQATRHADCRIADLASIDEEDAHRLLRLLRGEIGMREAWGHERLAFLPSWCRP